jgi:hypothetical protein
MKRHIHFQFTREPLMCRLDQQHRTFMSRFRTHLRILALAGIWAFIVGAAPALAGDNPCVNDWSEAAVIVKSEGLLPVDKLAELVKVHKAGDIVKTTLCKEKDTYAYKIVVRDAKGQLKSLTLDAKTPFAK